MTNIISINFSEKNNNSEKERLEQSDLSLKEFSEKKYRNWIIKNLDEYEKILTLCNYVDQLKKEHFEVLDFIRATFIHGFFLGQKHQEGIEESD